MNVSEPSQVVWKREGMEYGEHTIVVKPSVDSQGLSFGVLDALVFTTMTDRDGQATVEPNSLRSSTDTTLRIALSTTISILAALLILALFLAYRRRKLQRQIHQQKSVGAAGVGNTGVRRWVDMRWVNSSKTELDKAGVERVGGDAVHMDKL
ncbi:hypothetical protein ONZ45_g6935 [Pleurotus djamor]|nr:hypothetical protein ONZ45_g6935 [Pleurotus djamor]